MAKLKLGVLGVSRHFITRVLPALLPSEQIEVYGIASRDGVKANQAAAEYGIAKSYPSYEALLQDPAIDFIYNPLPNDLHATWIKKAADYGKPTLCEKPLTMNAAEAEAAFAYARQKGVKVMEAFMYRCHPQWQQLRDWVRFEEIGKIRAVHTFFGYTNLDPRNIRNIKANGGGALYDIGCYAISSARLIMQAEPQRVLAVLTQDPEFGTDTLTQAILDFGDSRAVFTVSTQTYPQQSVTIYGTGGVITVPIPFNPPADAPARVTVQTGLLTRTVEFAAVNQYLLLFEAFAASVKANTELPVSPADGVNNMKVIDALFQSAASGRWASV